MKQELQSLHGEVKSFRKAAEDRFEDVLFTHPEYRKLKTAAAVDWMINRVRDLDYPFSKKTEPMLSVWNQVLQEKREKMIEALAEAEKPEPKTKTVYIKKAGALGANGAADDARKGVDEKPGPGASRELPASLRPTEEWKKARIEQLRANVKAQRCGSWIAREFKVSPSLIGQILNGTDDLNSKTRSVWLDRINAAFKKHNALTQGVEAYKELKNGIKAEGAAGFDSGSQARQLLFPVEDVRRGTEIIKSRSASAVSNMSVTVDANNLCITVNVDIAEAVRILTERLALLKNDNFKITLE
jgi:hypothetical protein